MSNSIINDVTKRHDFALLFDVTDGNPNGDPDAGNLPRVDPETMQGMVTDVCLKRKVRNWIDTYHGNKEKYKIYIQNRSYLVDHKKRAYEAVDAKKGEDSKIDKAREWMCNNFYDIRAFGGVLVGKKNEGYNCGQVRGPIQLTFGRSVDPIVPLDISITRVALENPGDKPRESEDEKATTGTMGRKALLPYGLYKSHGFFSPSLAKDTGLSSEDLELFWTAVQDMWDIDRSASRGMMACRGIYIFSHEKETGNAPAHKLLERITVKKKDSVGSPRSFSDYKVTVDDKNLQAGVTITTLAV
ncbi:MAG TPA: type I-C CRISPR-associated protein Cas7/Csd2 [Candidatus Wujingus californicus]|uniref:type I-C CRISPR-associated protein Cas7/Csd2 n=1 Tax=Candidatus Wujingus californicus TaxID=3367618 RepID=UPI001DDAAE57|nr:type I-C CRISPR-associated protein Cas7/Csd2 [Planctomycetota bacterium]MDO8094729.1 type I-C CRISPR-associated protein Cas7/Csd2 [Candidatus Brocadiales bacterium]